MGVLVVPNAVVERVLMRFTIVLLNLRYDTKRRGERVS